MPPFANCVSDYPEVAIYDLQSEAGRVVPGDFYMCADTALPVEVAARVRTALDAGAVALLLPAAAEGAAELQDLVPPSVPAFYVESVEEAATRLAVAFYGAPSRDLLTVAVVGTHGKTTTSWLIRGMLEEMKQVCCGDVM